MSRFAKPDSQFAMPDEGQRDEWEGAERPTHLEHHHRDTEATYESPPRRVYELGRILRAPERDTEQPQRRRPNPDRPLARVFSPSSVPRDRVPRRGCALVRRFGFGQGEEEDKSREEGEEEVEDCEEEE